MFTEILYPFDTWKECLDFNSDALEDFNKDKKPRCQIFLILLVKLN